MAMTKPIVDIVNAFDANQNYTFTFSSVGGNQVVKNEILIKDNDTSEQVYTNIVESYVFSQTVSANTLQNGKQYVVLFRTYGADNTVSEWSNATLFYCYTTPSLSLNVTEGQRIGSATFTFELTYNQEENELLDYAFIELYDANTDSVIERSKNLYNSSQPPFTLSYTFEGLVDESFYKIKATTVTLEQTVTETELIEFYVRYDKPQLYSNLVVESKNCDGYIDIATNYIDISGDPYPINPIYEEEIENLLNLNFDSTDKNGVTCTNNGDGTYTLNGTATAEARFDVGYIQLNSGSYKVLGCPPNGSTATYSVRIGKDAQVGGTYVGSDIGNGLIINPTTTTVYAYGILIKKGATVNNIIYKPMITKTLTAKYDDYIQYSESGAVTNINLCGADHNILHHNTSYNVVWNEGFTIPQNMLLRMWFTPSCIEGDILHLKSIDDNEYLNIKYKRSASNNGDYIHITTNSGTNISRKINGINNGTVKYFLWLKVVDNNWEVIVNQLNTKKQTVFNFNDNDNNVSWNMTTDLTWIDEPTYEDYTPMADVTHSLANSLDIMIIGNGIFDHLNITKDTSIQYTEDYPTWNYKTNFDCDFDHSLNGGNINVLLSQLSSVRVKRRNSNNLTWTTIYEQEVTKSEDLNINIKDPFVPSFIEQTYAFVPILNGNIEGDYVVATVTPKWKGTFLTDGEKIFKLYNSVLYENTTQNTQMGVLTPIGAKYPIIIQMVKQIIKVELYHSNFVDMILKEHILLKEKKL